MTNSYCPRCQGTNAATFRRPEAVDRRRPGLTFIDELSQCPDCGAEFYTFDQATASSQARTAAIRNADSLVSPEDIRSARLRLNMSQPEFELALGVGKKTVGRWERGTVPPSGGANIGLWLAVYHPDQFLEYARPRLPQLPEPFVMAVGTSHPQATTAVATTIKGSGIKRRYVLPRERRAEGPHPEGKTFS